MAGKSIQRRLAAILTADVVGYSKMMGSNETNTLSEIKTWHNKILQPLMAKYNGRIVKLMGDGVLAEFGSVVNAVECAVEMQKSMAANNDSIQDDKKIILRIGINLGDVILDGDDLYGDGINVAARLEAMAEPGGICISDDAHRQVRDKLEIAFEDVGDHKLKNIARPLRVYRVRSDSKSAARQPSPALPNKPSIAVLPFDNMSGDPEQEYFSDGITEDIITELTRFQSLFVIARNSSFAFKGQATDITEIGKKLGVQYVVEGGVRKAGERIRITAQLIDATTGNHLWAERYDRNITDIFAVQDEVASQVVSMVPGHVEIANRVQAERKPTQDMNAYDLMLRAMSLTYQDFTSGKIVQLMKQALEIDPEYGTAHAILSSIYAYSVFVHGRRSDENDALAISHAETALKLEPSNSKIHALAADAYLVVGKHELAKYHIDKAITLNPNDFVAMGLAGFVKAFQGDYDGAVTWVNKALHSDPFASDAYREVYFEVHFLGGQYELALEQLLGWQFPPKHIYLEKAAALAQLGRTEEAHEAIRQFELVRLENWNIVDYVNTIKRMCVRPEDAERWLEGFRKAGLKV
ncbi:MAG: adenylate/guanylate cyclase domain-containing protein [Pseudomonadota bacterium]